MKRTAIFLILLSIIAFISCTDQTGEWKIIFDGKDLSDWSASVEPDTLLSDEGLKTITSASGELLYLGKSYRNFEMAAEIKISGSGFSVIRFHTPAKSGEEPAGYEVVLNNQPRSMDEKKWAMTTGSLLGVRHAYFQMVPEDEWFWLTIRVSENHIKTFINDIKVVDYVQPENPYRSDTYKSRVTGKGTFAIRTDAGSLTFRSIKVKSLPEEEPFASPVDSAWDARVTKMMENYFPLIDFHVHLKGGLTIDQAIINSQKLGINYGIAPNCGLKFPVTDDASLAAYMDTVKGKPIFRGMQAEGREWITLFSPESVAKFDYVFTDALTFTDNKGRRNRLWIPEEVWVDDKQKFMDQLTGKIEAIFSQEPVDIYVNPTMLPAQLMPEYDQLWTPDRMERVIKVLKENNIALEINARYKIPSPAFIRAAKEAGLKFIFGTNNAAAELGQLEYSLQMMEECGLQPEDMFLPKPQAQKPVLVKGLPAKITG